MISRCLADGTNKLSQKKIIFVFSTGAVSLLTHKVSLKVTRSFTIQAQDEDDGQDLPKHDEHLCSPFFLDLILLPVSYFWLTPLASFVDCFTGVEGLP